MKLAKRLWTGICLAAMLLLPAKEMLGQPFKSCEDFGLTLVAKFELQGNSYKFEKPKGNQNIVSVDGDGQSADWSSSVAIQKIILFGGQDVKTYELNATDGSFDNSGMRNPGGQTPGISNVQFCGAKTPPPPPPNGDPGDCPCEGKATYLALQYQGQETVNISVRMRRGPSTDVVVIGSVNPGQTFEVSGLPGPNPGFDGTLGTDIFIMYNGQEQPIHTSCSQPLFIGQQHGVFEVMAFASKQGGLCPPVDKCPFVDPPTVSYEVVEQDGDFFIDVNVVASVAIASLELIHSTTKNDDLELVSSDEDLDEGRAFYRFKIIDLTADYEIRVFVTDECELECPADPNPPVFFRTPFSNFTSIATVVDLSGVYTLQFFNLTNIVVEELDWQPGDTEVQWQFRVLADGFATFGFLTANQCHAFIRDPAMDLEDGTKIRLDGMGNEDGVAFQGPGAEIALEIPEEVVLQPNYPNPFNPSTQIAFGLPEASQISLRVFDILGREVAVLIDGGVEAGWHQVAFDASHLSGGTYFYVLRTPARVATGSMVLMK